MPEQSTKGEVPSTNSGLRTVESSVDVSHYFAKPSLFSVAIILYWAMFGTPQADWEVQVSPAVVSLRAARLPRRCTGMLKYMNIMFVSLTEADAYIARTIFLASPGYVHTMAYTHNLTYETTYPVVLH